MLLAAYASVGVQTMSMRQTAHHRYVRHQRSRRHKSEQPKLPRTYAPRYLDNSFAYEASVAFRVA